jgi:hypothetical protein
MEQTTGIMIERLLGKGMEIENIPPYIRDLANALSADGEISLSELNRRLHLLGWGDFELDDQTLQLIMIHLEADVLQPLKGLAAERHPAETSSSG